MALLGAFDCWAEILRQAWELKIHGDWPLSSRIFDDTGRGRCTNAMDRVVDLTYIFIM
jgi:hypothetical protein